MTTLRVTEVEYQQMSWHDRQRYNDRLLAETKRLEAQIALLRGEVKPPRPRSRTNGRYTPAEQAAVIADATAQLAALPADRFALARQEHLTAS